VIRFALIAYLSAITALGPALCCCNLRQLSSLCNGPQCCGKTAKATDSSHHHHHCDGNHHHRHHVSEGERDGSRRPENDGPPKTPSRDSDDCPCKEHRSNLVSAPGPESANSHGSVDLSFARVPLPIFLAAERSISDASHGVSLGDETRCLLFGRGILRAYQTLRC
jgi:hypothetical protein